VNRFKNQARTPAFCVVWFIYHDTGVGRALTFASEAKFEIEAKISFHLEAKKKA
jgi:hypothetical protein